MDWWESVAAMRRIARIATAIAAVGLLTGMLTGTTSVFIAAPAFFVGAAGVVCAMFAWFRAEHLRDLDDIRSSPR
jgi:hypothetical protein